MNVLDTVDSAGKRITARQEVLARLHECQNRYQLTDTEAAAILAELLGTMLALKVAREQIDEETKFQTARVEQLKGG